MNHEHAEVWTVETLRAHLRAGHDRGDLANAFYGESDLAHVERAHDAQHFEDRR